MIANAMADVFGLMYGTRPKPAPARRPINQPAAGASRWARHSRSRWHRATTSSSRSTSEEAPLTVGRFLELVGSTFYDGSFFYRLLPLNLIQAGSPRGNDLMGYGRFIRDELGRTTHRHGTVGWLSQGPDTGDSQFFVNLLDAPTRHHEYTVVGTVMHGPQEGVVVPWHGHRRSI